MAGRDEILRQALALPFKDREFVAAALEKSLAEANANADEFQAELLTELQRRSAAFQAGLTSARSAADVVARQRQQQVGETQT